MPEHGYSGKILKVDLSSGQTTTLPTSDYATLFLGGRGMAARLYWAMSPFHADPYDPDSCLIYATGPTTGFNRLASCRWQVCGKSPSMDTKVFSYANLGEKWGTLLKYAGYDGLIVHGKADRPCYLNIHDGDVQISDARSLWGMPAIEAADTLKTNLGKGVSVLTIGPAAENLVCFSTMLTDDGASGANGFGSVMGSKNLKAIVVVGDKKPVAADPERLSDLADRILQLRKDTWKDYLIDIPGRTRPRACYGCGIGCWRKSYEAEGGKRFKFFCQAAVFYWKTAEKYNQDWQEVTLLATRLCDRYGLDTIVMQPMITWLNKCYQEGILNEGDTGLPLSRIGSAEFIETLIREIAFREGFGDLLAMGMIESAGKLGKAAQELLETSILTRGNETRDYDPRIILTSSLLYATEPRRPINQIHQLSHTLEAWLNWMQKKEGSFLSYDDFLRAAKTFWGSATAADFTSYEGKALAAKKIQDRAYAKESLVLCDFLWPITWVRFAEDHTGDPTIESKVVSAITGREIDEAGLNRIGERVFNLQRAILLQQGWGGRQGDKLLDYLHDEPLQDLQRIRSFLVPGKNGEPVSRQGKKIEREDFEKLKSEYYELRGWNKENGFPTREKLTELELEDIAVNLQESGLLG